MSQRKRPFITQGKNNHQSNVLHHVPGRKCYKTTLLGPHGTCACSRACYVTGDKLQIKAETQTYLLNS